MGALFLTNGAIFANLLARYPQLKRDLGLTNAELGAAIAAFPLGALVAGLAGGALVHRFRSSRVAVAGTLITGVALVLAGTAAGWLVLAGAMLVAGAMDALVDVAQNAHGLRVQRHYGRSILNAFHAVWSAGAVLGGVMGSAAAGLGVPVALHLAGSGLLFALVAFASYRYLLPGPEGADRTDPPPPRPPDQSMDSVETARPRYARAAVGVLLALGVIAASGAVVEDAGASWGAIYLTDDLGAAPAVAGLAFVALQAMQFIGRLLGDRVVDRYGQRTVARAGALTTTVGMGVALLAPTTVTTLVGFGAAGLGIATLIPAAMRAADELPGLPPGAGLAAVSWLLRVGFLLSPPIVGAIADAAGLRTGLLIVPLAGVAVLLLSRHLEQRPVPAAAGYSNDA